MSKKTGWILLAISFLAVIAYALQRDLIFEKAYTGDLRNRVVGARLIKDGHSPYFYKWKPGDPIRYYNPYDYNDLKISAITASPFFHHLLSPIVELRQTQLWRLWLAIEYILFVSIVALALSLTSTTRQQQLVMLFATLFPLSNAWQTHVFEGQNYIFIPFFAALFYYCARRKNERRNIGIGFAAAAGCFAACLLFTRPNTLLFFLPFLFLARHYSRAWLLTFSLPLLLLSGWTLCNHQERQLWQDYRIQVYEWAKAFNGEHPTQSNKLYIIKKWEGIDMDSAAAITPKKKIYKENGTVYNLTLLIFNRKLSVPLLGILALGIILLLLLVFYFLNRPFQQQDLARTAIFGFCLYMISDLFSPIWRHPYYFVQWIFPLLLAASIYHPRHKALYWLLLATILLSYFHFPFLKMGNTIGEYSMLATLLFLSLPPAPSPAGTTSERHS